MKRQRHPVGAGVPNVISREDRQITVEVSGDIGSWDARLLAQKGNARREDGKVIFTLD